MFSALPMDLLTETELLPPDPNWPLQFQEEVARLRIHPLLEATPMEHVGSTAVADMPAKPVIDILVGVADPTDTDLRLAFQTLGYAFEPGVSDAVSGRLLLFRHRVDGTRAFHLNIVPYQGLEWNNKLAFRNRLAADDDLRMAYAQLKYELAFRYIHDRKAYSDGKNAFARAALALV